MQRLSFEESWKFLWENTALVDQEEPIYPDGPAGWVKKNRKKKLGGGTVAQFKEPEINETVDGEEPGLWNLENLTMPSLFFYRCGVNDISFRNTSLVDSFFCWNDFIEVDFTEADLSRCDMRCSIFEDVQFVRTDLCDADLRLSSFENCDFTDANMAGTKMTLSQAKDLPLSEKQKSEIAWKRSSGRPPHG